MFRSAFVDIAAWRFSGMWPEVTIEASNHAEVNCLVRALSREGHVMRVRDGFRVEVGGASPAAILSAIQACLIKEGIESVSVVLRTGRKLAMSRPA